MSDPLSKEARIKAYAYMQTMIDSSKKEIEEAEAIKASGYADDNMRKLADTLIVLATKVITELESAKAELKAKYGDT